MKTLLWRGAEVLAVAIVVVAICYGPGLFDRALGWPPPGDRITAAIGCDDAGAFDAALRAGATARSRDGAGSTPLACAAAMGRLPMMRRLLAMGAEVDATDCYDRTPLMWAAQAGHADAVALLLERGADPSLKDCLGHTALDTAAMRGDPETVAVLGGPGRSGSAPRGRPESVPRSSRP